jgi:transcriptional regulator with XRE-family HTH domain
MEIAIADIRPDPETVNIQLLHRNSSPVELLVVVRPDPDDSARWLLVTGAGAIEVRRSYGATMVDAVLLDPATPERTVEVQLAAAYAGGSVAPLDFARALLNYRERFGLSQHEAAQRLDITPGTIHHYESLVRSLAPDLAAKVEQGRLTFKEARSIADISDHERQREIAEPFVTGRLSSVYVEKIVGYARKAPGRPVQEVIEDVIRGTKAAAKVTKNLGPAPRASVDLARLETSVLEVAGVLDAVQLQTIPEYRRLKLASTVRILRHKVDGLLSYLSDDARPGAFPLARSAA